MGPSSRSTLAFGLLGFLHWQIIAKISLLVAIAVFVLAPDPEARLFAAAASGHAPPAESCVRARERALVHASPPAPRAAKIHRRSVHPAS